MMREFTSGLMAMVLIALIAVACTEQGASKGDESGHSAVEIPLMETPYVLGLPSHFPDIMIPEDNPLTLEKVALGERLFFDPFLSVDSSVSCASCHLPARAFSDVLALSAGAKATMTTRNAPSLMNVAFHPHFMREGGVPNLELQVLSPLEGETEMAHNIVGVCERLNADTAYRNAFLRATGSEATPFTVTRLIASFERTLIGGDAPFDAWIQGDAMAMSAAQVRGYELFISDRLACTSCHSGILFSSFEIENNGLKSEYEDKGLFRLTLKDADIGKFKVPSLRNIELTAPYMHDGSLNSLDEVLDHYAMGGSGHPNQAASIRPFRLKEREKKDLLEFFNALTETSATKGR